MHRKGAQDAKRARIFAKIIREITVSAREGLPDPASNPRLRAAVAAGLKQNMTRDTIDRAIKKATGAGQGDNYESVRYEGHGPGGVAIIVEALTDNRNRTASVIRAAFNKHGGALGETQFGLLPVQPARRGALPGQRRGCRCHAGSGDRGRRRRCGERCGIPRGHGRHGRVFRRARRAGAEIRRSRPRRGSNGART